MSLSYNCPLTDPINREEEVEVAKLAAQGDKRARDQLISANVRWAIKFVQRYRGLIPDYLYEDLVQESLNGLVTAADKFDITRGIKFSTYATFWMRAKVMRFLEKTRFIKIATSNSERKLAMNLRKLENKLSFGSNGELPTDEEIAKALGDETINAEDVAEMRVRLMSKPFSLDAPAGHDSNQSLSNTVGDPTSFVDTYDDEELRRKVRSVVQDFTARADARTRVIVKHRIYAEDPEELESLGQRLGVSRERVRQLEKQILTDLREFLEDHLDEEDLVPKPTKTLSVGKVTKLLSDWSKETGIPRHIIQSRMNRGRMTPEEIISTRYVPWTEQKEGAKAKPEKAKNICIVCLKAEATVKVNQERTNPTHCEDCSKKAAKVEATMKAAVETSLARADSTTSVPAVPSIQPHCADCTPQAMGKRVERVRQVCKELDEIESTMKDLIQKREERYGELNGLLQA